MKTYQRVCAECDVAFSCSDKRQIYCSLKCAARARSTRSTAPEKRKQDFEMRFRVTPGCWAWTASVNRQQYGEFVHQGETLAHRVSYRLYVGPIPDGMCILHRCDNPSCVNPDHLSAGTRAENLDDMTAKGRRVRGTAHGRAKLSEADVLSIRKDCRRTKQIAAEHGISRATVSLIQAWKIWAHL